MSWKGNIELILDSSLKIFFVSHVVLILFFIFYNFLNPQEACDIVWRVILKRGSIVNLESIINGSIFDLGFIICLSSFLITVAIFWSIRKKRVMLRRYLNVSLLISYCSIFILFWRLTSSFALWISMLFVMPLCMTNL